MLASNYSWLFVFFNQYVVKGLKKSLKNFKQQNGIQWSTVYVSLYGVHHPGTQQFGRLVYLRLYRVMQASSLRGHGRLQSAEKTKKNVYFKNDRITAL